MAKGKEIRNMVWQKREKKGFGKGGEIRNMVWQRGKWEYGVTKEKGGDREVRRNERRRERDKEERKRRRLKDKKKDGKKATDR